MDEQKRIDIALLYCVDDFPSASVPSTSLQKILDCLWLGKPVTPLSLAFLQKKGLEALHHLSTGKVPYDRFREMAIIEQSIRVETATKITRLRESENSVMWASREAKEAAMLASREAKEAAMQASWKRDQLAMESDPKYIAKIKHQKLRARYGIKTYIEQHCFSRLMDILKRVDASQRLSQEDFVWLSSVGEDYFTAELRAAYHRLEADFFASEFKKTGDAWAAVSASCHYRKCSCPGDAESILRTIRIGYGINIYSKQHCIKQHCFSRLMDILKRVDASQRLSQEDFVWLSSVGEDYFTAELRAAYHRLEADFFASEFKKTGDAWAAVSASCHYRKCSCPGDAESILRTIHIDQQKTLKLKSALCTTHGGVMRDLKNWREALQFGEKGHAFTPDDYRPCTLLGAVYMETGNYDLGQEWYDKAVERGAPLDSIDRDLRNIFFQLDQVKRIEMSEFLLREDPIRYAWATPKVKDHNGR